MDLTERYLQAVRFWLPRENQDDIVAELREDLRSQQEEAEERLGRPLGDTDTADLLRRTGNPLQVAGHYLPARPGLDPALAMIYRFVVKVVLLWILTPLFAVIAVPAALLSHHPLTAMAGAFAGFAQALLMALGSITFVFLLVDAGVSRSKGWKSGQGLPWDPMKLPALRPEGAKPWPRTSSAFEVVFGLLFAAWWMESPLRLPLLWNGQWRPDLASSGLWTAFHDRWGLAVLAVMLANVAVACVMLARPHWVRFRLAYGVVSGALPAIMCLATLAGQRPELHARFAAVATLGRAGQDAAAQGLAVDGLVAICLLAVGLGSAIAALSHGIRLIWTPLPILSRH